MKGCLAWGIYIFLFFFIPFILGSLSKMFLDTMVLGLTIGIILDIFLFMFFVRYLRRQRGI